VFGLLSVVLPSPETAEEIVQDAFHSVWRRAASYRADRGSVRTWLLAIARNAAIDWHRTRGRRSEREGPLEDAGELSDPKVEESLDRVIRSERVRTALDALPQEQRDVIVLAFYGGLTQPEIAARTGAPVGTVKSRARLAMDKLRETLAVDR
jgi:RNA polymerase sigma-70 factor (ECF subfamily)